jgi:hypothetical protein
MTTKLKEMQKVIRYYKEETGKTEVDMKEVVRFAVTKLGWKVPPPKDPVDRLVSEFSKAARDEIRYDDTTGKPYRANHAYPVKQGEVQFHLWIDIDEAPRHLMLKSLIMRREQMVNDGLQLTYDADHWNSINPSEKPIQLVLDFTEDIEERKLASSEKKSAA